MNFRATLLTGSIMAAGFLAGTEAAETKIGVHTFTHPDDYQVELVAAPPLADRPIVADFDERGRLYVADSSGSNDPVKKQLEEKPHRIVRLEDTNGDGKFDQQTVFADKMMFPEGSMWLDGSLYVTAPPVIWKLTDTNDDGVADKREEWVDAKTLTGCANDLHGPYRGPDGWIYWCKGAFAEQIWEQTNSVPFKTRAAHIFRRRPEGGVVEAVMTGGMDNPVDVAFTPEGERFFTTTFFQHPGGGQRDGLVHAIYGGVYGKVHDVLDGHKRTGEVMPVLTHLGPAAPSGLARLEHDPVGRTLVAANFNLHKVTRHLLKPKGATFTTEDSDLLASDQTDFHPTDVIEDADGSILVIDTGGWYKICCPTSQLHKPDVLGAIYRISKKGAKLDDPRGTKLSWTISPLALAHRLADARPAVRRQAADRLSKLGVDAVGPIGQAYGQNVLRKDGRLRAAVLKEAALVTNTEVDFQVEYVWALTRIDSPEARKLVRGFLTGPATAAARQAAVASISLWRDGGASRELLQTLADHDPQLVRVAAEALGRIGNVTAIPNLLETATRLDPESPDRVLEHSLCYALIELNDPKRLEPFLAAKHPAARRIALIALDQMERQTLQPTQVVAMLSAKEPAVQQAARWVVSHRRGWGAELIPYFNEQLAGPSEELGQLEELLAFFWGEQVVQRWATDQLGTLPARRAQLLLRALGRSGLKQAPEGLGKALAGLFKKRDLAGVAITALRGVPFEASVELSDALMKTALDATLPLETRAEALAAIPGGARELSPILFDFLIESVKGSTEAGLRGHAATALSKATLNGEQLEALAAALRSIGPVELPRVLAAFEKSASESVGRKLVSELQGSGTIQWLSGEQVTRIFAKYPETVRESLREALAAASADTLKQREQIDHLLVELKDGDIRRGQAVFNSTKAACSTCHAIGYLGGDLGPDLTRIGQIRTERDLLEAVLFPNASFVRSYEPMVVVTSDGEQHSGVLKRDSAEEVVLATGPNLSVRLKRSEITSMRPGTVSVMPQGLDQQLSKPELADLLAFLKATRW